MFELIIEYAATHPHRDWTIGIKPYSDIPMEVARKENFEHWELLADAILKEFVRREDMKVCDCYELVDRFNNQSKKNAV